MAIQDTDLLYVQRPSGVDAGGYKITAGDLLNGAGGGSSVTVDETAPLNPAEGDLWWADSDVDEGGGRLYVWTGDEWVDTSLPGGGAGEFLSKTDDDTAAGAITFQQDIKVEGDVIGSVFKTENDGTYITVDENTAAGVGFFTGSVVDGSTQAQGIFASFGTTTSFQKPVYGINSFIGANVKSVDSISSYFASIDPTVASDDFVAGYHSSINVGSNASLTGNEYNFYAEGNAPNYFGGFVEIDASSTPNSPGIKITPGTNGAAIIADNTNAAGAANTLDIRTAYNYASDKQMVKLSSTANRNNINSVALGIYDNGLKRIALDFDGSSLFVRSSDVAADYCQKLNRLTSTSSARFIQFDKNSTLRSQIRDNNTDGVIIDNGSDYRLKTNIEDLPSATEAVKKLRPVQYELIENPGLTIPGFIAHEIGEVVSVAAIGEKDEVDEQGEPVYQGIDTEKLIPYLTKALQEMIAKNEELEARIAAIEGGNN